MVGHFSWSVHQWPYLARIALLTNLAITNYTGTLSWIQKLGTRTEMDSASAVGEHERRSSKATLDEGHDDATSASQPPTVKATLPIDDADSEPHPTQRKAVPQPLTPDSFPPNPNILRLCPWLTQVLSKDTSLDEKRGAIHAMTEWALRLGSGDPTSRARSVAHIAVEPKASYSDPGGSRNINPTVRPSYRDIAISTVDAFDLPITQAPAPGMFLFESLREQDRIDKEAKENRVPERLVSGGLQRTEKGSKNRNRTQVQAQKRPSSSEHGKTSVKRPYHEPSMESVIQKLRNHKSTREEAGTGDGVKSEGRRRTNYLETDNSDVDAWVTTPSMPPPPQGGLYSTTISAPPNLTSILNAPIVLPPPGERFVGEAFACEWSGCTVRFSLTQHPGETDDTRARERLQASVHAHLCAHSKLAGVCMWGSCKHTVGDKWKRGLHPHRDTQTQDPILGEIRTFGDAKGLRRHIYSLHLGVRVRCGLGGCTKEFTRPSGVVRHQKTCTGEKKGERKVKIGGIAISDRLKVEEGS